MTADLSCTIKIFWTVPWHMLLGDLICTNEADDKGNRFISTVLGCKLPRASEDGARQLQTCPLRPFRTVYYFPLFPKPAFVPEKGSKFSQFPCWLEAPVKDSMGEKIRDWMKLSRYLWISLNRKVTIFQGWFRVASEFVPRVRTALAIS